MSTTSETSQNPPDFVWFAIVLETGNIACTSSGAAIEPTIEKARQQKPRVSEFMGGYVDEDELSIYKMELTEVEDTQNSS